MKYFDTHLGLPDPSEKGVEALLRHIESERGFVGGNLILNTKKEVDIALRHLTKFPPTLRIIPPYTSQFGTPSEFKRSGWFKIHPRRHDLEQRDIRKITAAIRASSIKPKGIVVCCFPWGPETKHNISLPLVLELAKAFPAMPVLATHGGGYASWEFRAHAGSLKNVFFDFSATMFYYSGSDLLRPFQRYLLHSRDRILFGSDWPTGNTAKQIAECVRLAREVSISMNDLERIFLDNARRLWPDLSRPLKRGAYDRRNDSHPSS
jgi:hypothetical protein